MGQTKLVLTTWEYLFYIVTMLILQVTQATVCGISPFYPYSKPEIDQDGDWGAVLVCLHQW